MMWAYLIGAYFVVGLIVMLAVKSDRRKRYNSVLSQSPNWAVTILVGSACWPLVAAFSLGNWLRKCAERRTEKTGSENRGAWLKVLQSAEKLVKENETAFRASEAHTIIHGLREVAMRESHWQESIVFRASGSALGSLKEFFQSAVHPKDKLEAFLTWQAENDFHGTVVERPMDLHIRLLDSFFDSVQLVDADAQQRILETLPLLNAEFENRGIRALKDSGTEGLIIKHLDTDSYVFAPHANPAFVNLLCWCADRHVIFEPCTDPAEAWRNHQREKTERTKRRTGHT